MGVPKGTEHIGLGKITFIALALVARCACAQSAPSILSQTSFTAAKQRLDPKAIPNYTNDFTADAKQSFLIPSATGKVLEMVPVKYESYTPRAGNTADRCGIFFLHGDTAPVFVPTIGYDFTETVFCGGLKAVGFMPGGEGGFPRLLLIYRAGTGNSSGMAPLVLDYSLAESRYRPNEKLSTNLDDDNSPPTIAGMKAAIRRAGQ